MLEQRRAFTERCFGILSQNYNENFNPTHLKVSHFLHQCFYQNSDIYDFFSIQGRKLNFWCILRSMNA